MQSNLQLSEVEIEMMQEVHQVYLKYENRVRNFGFQLVHSHFPIEENEILLETHDKEQRVLTIKPVELGTFDNTRTATAWQFKKDGMIVVAMQCCNPGGEDTGTIGGTGPIVKS